MSYGVAPLSEFAATIAACSVMSSCMIMRLYSPPPQLPGSVAVAAWPPAARYSFVM